MSSRGRRIAGEHSGRELRRRVRFLLLVASSLFFFSLSSTSHAYPWMIKHGFDKCASCHTDPMGGETLTGFGRVMSDTTLSTRWGATEPEKKAELFFGVVEPRDVNIGGSIRYMTFLHEFPKSGAAANSTSFPMQIDTYGQVKLFGRLRLGGSLGLSKVDKLSPHARAAQITANNDGDQYNALSRTHWVGFDITDNVLLRAGRLNLPFGMRIPEHVMWVRDVTRTDRESDQQDGVALSYSGGRWRGEAMGILGNYQMTPDKFRERGYSAYLEYSLSPSVAIGGSSLITYAKADRIANNGESNTRQAHGLTARVAATPAFAILAEADYLLSTQTRPGYAAFVQGDYEFTQGFHGMLTGEIRDAGKSTVGVVEAAKGAGKAELGGWVSLGWFVYTHFDVRMDLVVREQSPVTFQSQIHYYF
jgi:hypothetical protein